MTKRLPFHYFKTSLDIIRLAVMLFIRFFITLFSISLATYSRGAEQDNCCEHSRVNCSAGMVKIGSNQSFATLNTIVRFRPKAVMGAEL